VLEVLVHLMGGGAPVGYSLVAATVPDSLVEDIPDAKLPGDWNVSPVPPSVQRVGDEWISSGRSLALRVPSVIVDGGFNILINPAHAAFTRLRVDSIVPFDFDPRLLR
jgi:RES domain-containing protein